MEWGFAFVLLYKTFWAGWRVTLLRSSEWNNTFFTGTPLRCILLRKESGGASAEIMHA